MKKLIEWLINLRWFYLPKYITSRFHTNRLESFGEGDIEVCILYGKSRFLQWIYIFNPFKITPYKRKYSKLVRMFNCGWITKKEWDQLSIKFNGVFNKIHNYFDV